MFFKEFHTKPLHHDPLQYVVAWHVPHKEEHYGKHKMSLLDVNDQSDTQ